MIYVLLTNGFEEVEAITPIDIMRRAGLSVQTAAVGEGLTMVGSHQIPVTCDISLDEIDVDSMDALILPGGPGHTSLDGSAEVQRLIDYAVSKNILVAAICASPSILGKKGLLDGRKATSFPGFEKYLIGAEITGEKAVKDGNFITARGAGASAEFGFLITETLAGKEIADELKGSMQY